MRVCVTLAWGEAQPVAMDQAGKLVFPAVPAAPGVYRLAFKRADDAVAYYVGEAEDLRQRMLRYRNPGPRQPTNLRVSALAHECLARGGQVWLALACEVAIEVDGRSILLDLAVEACRLLVENAALVALLNAGAPVHNR